MTIAFNLEVDSRRALKGLVAVDNTLAKMLGRKGKLGDKFDTDALKKFRGELGSSRKQLLEMEKAFGSSKVGANLAKNFEAIKKANKSLQKVLIQGEKEIAEAAKSNDKDKLERVRKHWKKVVDESQKGLEKEQRALRGKAGKGGAAKYLAKRSQTVQYYNDRRGEMGKNGVRGPSQNKKDFAEAASGIFDSLKGKDLLGVGKNGGKLGAALANALGKRSFKMGDSLSQKGAKKGGMMGAVMGHAGEAMKGAGGLVATLAKLGPILSLAGGVMSSLITMLIDIEAKAKEMNKTLLEGSATAGFMGAHMGDATLAAEDLSNTLNTVRDQATDIKENYKWGTNADDVIRMTNAYSQQGLTLDTLNSAFKTANASSNEAGKSVASFGNLARVSFGYSKLLGVSLQEITDFQAEMFTEMGTSLGDLRLEFSRMTRDANESSIAANKFFGILRGVSADLSLYTTRLGQASAALKLIGKAMSSREASKFLSSLANGYKQMSEEDRLKSSLLMGEDKAREIVNKDLASKTKKFYSEVAAATGATIEEIKSASEGSAKDSGKALEGILNRTEEGKKKMGALMGTNSELMQDKNALVDEKGNKRDKMGVAEAMSNLSIGASFDAEAAAFEHFGGKGRIGSVTGVKGYAARKSVGWSQEKQRQMAKMQDSVTRQRGSMKDDLTNLQGRTDLKPEEQARLDRMKSAGLNSAADIDKASTGDIINAMEVSDQEALIASQEHADFQQQTANYTRGVMDLLQLAIDGIFESMYQVMLSIWETLSSSKLLGGDPDKTALQKGVMASKNPAVMKAFKDSGGDPEKMKAALLGSWGDRQKMAADPETTGKIGKALGDKDKLREALMDSAMFGGTLDAKGAATMKAVDEGKTYEQFAAELSPEDRKTLNQKVLERSMSAEQLIGFGAKPGASTTAITDAAKGAAPGQPAPAPGAAAPPPAAAATTVASVPATPAEKEVIDTINLQGKDTVKNLQDLWALMSQQGIKVNKSHLSNDWQPILKKATLEGVREALFEQAIYSSSNSTALLDRMSNSGLDGVAGLASSYKPATAHAEGGAVTGIANGMAVFAPPGEGLTSIGPGERIVPAGNAGSGGGGINIHVNGIGGNDLAMFLKNKVAEGIYEYKRREKF